MAFQDYDHIKGSDKEVRDSKKEQLAEALAEAANAPKEMMLEVICHKEKQHTTARKIRFI